MDTKIQVDEFFEEGSHINNDNASEFVEMSGNEGDTSNLSKSYKNKRKKVESLSESDSDTISDNNSNVSLKSTVSN